MTTPSASMEDPAKKSIGSVYLAQLFDRHNVPQRERAKLVEELLGLAYHAAYRRIRGSHPMTLEEIETVARHMGESLQDVLLAGALGTEVSGSFVCNTLRLKCQFELGPELLTAPLPGCLVATHTNGGWIVTPSENADGSKIFEVSQVVLRSPTKIGRRIAVVDDNIAITDSVCQELKRAGFHAEAFHSFADLLNSLQNVPYDGYVLDWFIGTATARDTIACIRQTDPSCPIAVLTGQIEADRGVANDIADVVATYNVRFFEKPVTMAMVIATLSRLMSDQPRRPVAHSVAEVPPRA